MIQSMTGYGKSVLQLATKKISIEIKSLNSKNLDLNVRMPSTYKSKELAMRKSIAKMLVRGKVDFSIYVETTGEETDTVINKEIVRNYMTQLKGIATTKDIDDVELMKMAIKMPETFKTSSKELDEDEWSQIEKHIDIALENIVDYRTQEAKSLEEDFTLRITNIKSHLATITTIDNDRIEAVKERLSKAINDLKVDVDANRFEQELIYYLEKLDINEEKVRLANHLEYFIETLNTSDSNGKKLGFIVQEIGREINTTGSKANYAPMQKIVIQMKDELEKIKEQILNVL